MILQSLKKFYVKKSVVTLLIVITIICCLSLIYCIALENSLLVSPPEGEHLLEDYTNKLIIVRIIKDFLVVISSILGANLLISVIVDVRSKNSVISDFFSDEILSAPEFYTNLSDENKKVISSCLDAIQYFNGNIMLANINNIMKSELLKCAECGYYFKECSYVIDVVVDSDCFTKTCTKTIVLRSYNVSMTIENFPFAKVILSEINGKKTLELKSASIDGKPINMQKEISENKATNEDTLSKQRGYDSIVEYRYNKAITLKDNEDTKIAIKYICRCPLDDIVATYRSSVPCEKFTIEYKMDKSSSYKLIANAFGFINQAGVFTTQDNDYHLKVTYDNWVFNNDGAVITMNKKVKSFTLPN